MGSGSSVSKALVIPSSALIDRVMPVFSTNVNVESSSDSQEQASKDKVSIIETKSIIGTKGTIDVLKGLTPEQKLLSIRELVDNNSLHFQKLVDLHGDKLFVEKFRILEEIQRKVFYRMLMVEHVPDEFHQLDEIVSIQEFLALDSSSSAPIHCVFEKLHKFVCNYQTSYERWIEILSSLQDELLMQLIGDYDEYVAMMHPKNKNKRLSLASATTVCSSDDYTATRS